MNTYDRDEMEFGRRVAIYFEWDYPTRAVVQT